jgi:hypothetical protein
MFGIIIHAFAQGDAKLPLFSLEKKKLNGVNTT